MDLGNIVPTLPLTIKEPDKISRVVVIDESGRILDRWQPVILMLQDEGKTLKVLLYGKAN